MHLLGLILWGFIASFWIFYGLHIAYGALRLPIIKDIPPASDADCPRISILLAARDEEEKLPAALATLMEIDYPDLEVIAVDDRSQASTGDWLLFTDADVRFKPDVLRRAIALAKARNLEHLALMGDVEMVGFWETVLITFFGMAFHIATDPHRVANPNSRAYIGVGAFQLLRRAAYEASGTHRRLAMEVVDDMKLG